MNLTAKLILTFVLTACVAPCLAQGGKKAPAPQPVPDLSGTWVLDTDNSYADRPVRVRPYYTKFTMVIAQKGPEIKIRTETARRGGIQRLLDATYYSDGRGEKNQVFVTYGARSQRQSVILSKTQWKGRRLIVDGRETNIVGAAGLYREFTDTWELSEDGRTLIQTTRALMASATGPAGEPDLKRFYRRAP